MLPLWSAVLAFGFEVAPQQTQCFDERVSASDHVMGSWALVSDTHGKPLAAIHGWMVSVKGPAGDSVYTSEHESAGSFDYYATSEGIYNLCFTSSLPQAVEATAKVTVGDPPDLIELAKTEHLTPIEERIKNVRARARTVS